MRCDLCGSDGYGSLFNASVESSLMTICKKCLKFGKLVERNKNFNVNEVINKPKKIADEKINLFVKNHNLIIKQCREKMNLSQEELAQKLNEKASLLHKIEGGSITPNEYLTKKLEQFFKIKLTEDLDLKEEAKIGLNFKNSALTIGDLLKLKKKS